MRGTELAMATESGRKSYCSPHKPSCKGAFGAVSLVEVARREVRT